MATGDRTLYSDNTYISGRISAEASTRLTNDNIIQAGINTTKSTLAQAQTTSAGLGSAIANEGALLLAQVGDLDFGGLTWDHNGTPTVPQSITQAMNALMTYNGEVNSAINDSGNADLATIDTTLDTITALANSDKLKLDAILALSTSDKDSFAELLTMINSNDTDITNALNVCQAAIDSIVANKTNKLQTVNTDMKYTDKTTGKNYKLVISSGNLVLIEL